MRKISKVAVILIAVILLSSTFIFQPASVKAESKTIIVPDDFPTISSAIKNDVTVTGNNTIIEFSNGLHNVLVYANDSLGNIGASQTINFIIAVPPKISILSPLNQTYTNSNIPLTFNADKPANWLGYSIDEQHNTTITLSNVEEVFPDWLIMPTVNLVSPESNDFFN